MIQEICKDEKFLAQKAEQATPDDIHMRTTCWKRSKRTRTAVSAWRRT